MAVLALAIAMQAGCTAAVRPYNSYGETTSEVVHEKNYSVGVAKTVGVGEAMIRSKTYTRTTFPVNMMRPSHNSVLTFGIGRADLRTDQTYRIVGVAGDPGDENKVVQIWGGRWCRRTADPPLPFKPEK